MRRIKDKDAQGAVIGTIMALMVVISFLAFFTESYLPAAMYDMESEHMFEVLGQFASIRQDVDNLILMENTNTVLYSPVRMGSGNMPAFSSPTGGYLIFKPTECVMNVMFRGEVETGGVEQEVDLSGEGKLTFEAPNRYYIKEKVIYEGTGILKAQSEGNVMHAPPRIHFNSYEGKVNVSIVLITFSGAPKTIAGYDVVGIQTKLHFINHFNYENATAPLNITVQSDYTASWEDYLSTELIGHGLVENTDWNRTHWTDSNGDDQLTFIVSNTALGKVDITTAVIGINIGSGTVTQG